MIVLGVDPASTKTGLAVVDRGKADQLLYTEQFVLDRKATIDHNLSRFFKEVDRVICTVNVGHVVIERVHVSWNVNTIRKLAYFEAVAMLAAFDAGCVVEQLGVTTVRKKVFGSGKLKKEEAAELVRQRYHSTLTDDETDAIALALAANV